MLSGEAAINSFIVFGLTRSTGSRQAHLPLHHMFILQNGCIVLTTCINCNVVCRELRSLAVIVMRTSNKSLFQEHFNRSNTEKK